MISIFHFIFGIILFVRFENSSEQPRPFDLNELPVDEESSPNRPTINQERRENELPRLIDLNTLPAYRANFSNSTDRGQKKLEKSFITYYRNDQNKIWPELRGGILKYNVQQWRNVCIYLLKRISEQSLPAYTICEGGAPYTRTRGIKVVYQNTKLRRTQPVIENIQMLKCDCYERSIKYPLCEFFATKYSDTEYFIAKSFESKRALKLISLVRDVPDYLFNSATTVTHHRQFNHTHDN